jgi:hypothetical protein
VWRSDRAFGIHADVTLERGWESLDDLRGRDDRIQEHRSSERPSSRCRAVSDRSGSCRATALVIGTSQYALWLSADSVGAEL